MRFGILGPLLVTDDDGRELALGGRKQRAVLAILLLRANEVVPSDRIVEELWSGEAPASAAKSLQVHVSRLRRALGDSDRGDDERIVTAIGGYLVRVGPGELDRDVFERLIEEGAAALAAGSVEHAAERLGAALELWRGPPLSDFAYESFAQAEIAALTELHVSGGEQRIDAELALGRERHVIGDLERLVRAHPYRERLRCQLMLALYRCGRQADALAAYRSARAILVEELGIEPSAALSGLHDAILAHDRSLLAPALVRVVGSGPAGDVVTATVDEDATQVERARLVENPGAERTGETAPEDSGDPRARGPRASTRRPSRPTLIGGLVIVAAAALATILGIGSSTGAGVIASGDSVAVIAPGNDRVVADIAVGADPDAISAGAGALWVANAQDHTISEIGPASRRVLRTLTFGDPVDGVAAGGGALWAFDSTRDLANRVDPTFGTVVDTVHLIATGGSGGVLPSAAGTAVVAGAAAWFGNSQAQVVKVAGGRLSSTDVGNHPSGIAVGFGSTWVSDDFDDTVSRIDAIGDVAATIQVGRGASAIAVGAGAVWVVNTLDGTVSRIDPATDATTATIQVGSSPRGVAIGDGAVWVANSGDGTVSRLDPRAGSVIATIRVGHSPQALAVAGDAVWVSVQSRPPAGGFAPDSPRGIVRVSRERPFQTLDPALVNVVDIDEPQLLYEACAGLLGYPDRPGVAGEQLVPDVAAALPTVSDGGRTYTFTIRPGWRFSPPSGAAVTAATFMHTIERVLSPHVQGNAAPLMSDIVGARAYEEGRAPHLAGVTASGDRLRIRLTAPLPALPALLATLNFCAVPDDTPDAPQTQPIPMAGPYYIASSSPSQLVLARNPNYGGRRPRGPKEIVYTFGPDYTAAVAAVAAGRSDYVSAEQLALDANVPAALFAELQRRYGPASRAARAGSERYFVDPTLSLDSLALNTTRPPFASVRLRQAVNYAIDRQQLVANGGAFFGGRAISHYLPPGMPGSRPDAIYPLGAPDVAKARELAGGIAAQATMYTCNTAECVAAAQIVQTDLRAIGITVNISSMSIQALYARLARPGASWDIAWQNWQGDYADPSDFLTSLFDPKYGVDLGRFSAPAFVAAIRRAATLNGPRRLKVYGLLDDALARQQAPVVAWGVDVARDFFAARIGCETYQPLYGMDLGRLCISS